MQNDAAVKETDQNNAEYTLDGTILENVDKIKYLGVIFKEDFEIAIFAQRLTAGV